MKKIILVAFCILMTLSLLTGCIHQDVNVKINHNGTGSVTATLGIEKGYYEKLKGTASDPFAGKTVAEYTLDGSTYVSCVETVEYDSFEELEKALLDMTYNTEILVGEDFSELGMDKQDQRIFSTVYIEKSGGLFQSTIVFAATLNPQKVDHDDIDPNDFFKVSLSVQMPGEITGVTGGKVEGNTVIFDTADITKSEMMAVNCESTNIGGMIGIAAVLAVLLVGYILLSKRKK